MTFESLGLNPAILKAVQSAGYTTPTDVQAQAIPQALAGHDLMVSSSTGSGKTASFVLPALEGILAARGDNTKRREKGVVQGPRVLVLAPTRELAMQVSKAFVTYGRDVQGLRVATIVGGVPYAAQLKALRGPLDVLIATPGRLLDHLGSGQAVLANVQMLVLDEADRMLDMGFIDDITTIAEALPEARQTVMFSATFAGHVGGLAQRLTRDPQRIDVASHTDTHANIEQRLHWADSISHKNSLLESILAERELDQAVVFTSTQRDADWLADRLAEMGHAVAALHGGMPQGRRNRVLQGLRMRQLRVLVATDVAARGIDVPTITHVINYGLPMKAEDYVHRIGRTGRAGRDGLAITLAERRDTPMIRRIERFTTQRIPAAVIAGLEPKAPAPVERKKPEGWKPGMGKPNFKPRGEFAPRERPAGFGARDDRRAPAAGAPRDRTPFDRSSAQPARRQHDENWFEPARSFDAAPHARDAARGHGHQKPSGGFGYGDRPARGPGGPKFGGGKPAGQKFGGSKPFGPKRREG
ncbi:DEAD/DEAH box helicase [Caldimonas brevitalea]|uniref:RNA helicase n=1 Tax=Caldimonas brevitalea TaxID=413882 RepID=A0A0G3BKV1_9BURK|nr:DEAD/DEAH box helicase [Caldimonas brevitalea]AKJ30027.1 RNA helicase [Caldimonas brevitalea]